MTQSDTNPSESKKERASVLSPRASVTLEAALVIPLYFFAVLTLVYMLEIQAVGITIRAALQDAAKTAAADAVLLPAVNIFKFKSDVVQAAGFDRLDRSIVAGGSSGIDCSRTYYSPLSGEIKAVAEYSVQLPFPGFKNLTARFREEMRVKGWTGYTKRDGTKGQDKIVYLTDTALVYHEDYQCTYLQLSVRFTPFSGLEGLRSEDGGKYKGCEKCVHGETMAGVYITNTGRKYHNSLNCSGLKRTIHAVKKSDVGSRAGCSRCSGEG